MRVLQLRHRCEGAATKATMRVPQLNETFFRVGTDRCRWVLNFEDPAPSLGTEMVGQCILNTYFEDRDGGGKPPSDVQFGVR